MNATKKDGRKWVTEVCVVKQRQYEDGPIDMQRSYEDGSLMRFMASLTSIIEQIPEEYRDAARIDVDTDDWFDGERVTIVVTYDRPSTSEEISAAKKEQTAVAEAREAREREQLERLLSKYHVA